MSLDISLMIESSVVYGGNITHNLNTMAAKAGIYEQIWQPKRNGIIYAHQLVGPLQKGLEELVSNLDFYEQFNPANGWGDYAGLVRFVREYLEACKAWPEAKVRAEG